MIRSGLHGTGAPKPSPACGRGWREAPGEGGAAAADVPAPPRPRTLSGKRERGAVAAILCFLATPAFAQPTDNPIPASGGAIIFGEPESGPKDLVYRPDEISGGLRFSIKEQSDPHALDAGWKGEKTCALLDDNAAMRAFRCVFAPGAGHERHFHPRHWGYVVEGGSMRVTDGKGVRDLKMKAGDSWWSDGVEWHEALNIGDTTAIYVIVEPKDQ